MPIYALGDIEPVIADDAYVHPDAVVIGDVTIGSQASIWPNAVLRGDCAHIDIGARTSIQDCSVVHVDPSFPTVIGADCVIGHHVYLEGCSVEDHVLVASSAVLLHGVTVRSRGVVAAGAVVLQGTEIPSHAMALGVPAKVQPGAAQRDYVSEGIEFYVANSARYRESLRRID